MRRRVGVLLLCLVLFIAGMTPFELRVEAADSELEKIVKIEAVHKDKKDFQYRMNIEDQKKNNPLNKVFSSPEALESIAETGLYKSTLSGKALKMYEAVESAGITCDNNTAEITFTCEAGNVDTVVNQYTKIYATALWAYAYDHLDQFYWQIMNEVGMTAESNSTGTGGTIYCGYTVSPYYTSSMEASAKSKLKTAVKKCNDATNTVYGRLEYLNKWICDNCTYDYTGLNAENYSQRHYYAHTAMGLLLKKTGVCESYAKVLKLACMQLKIPCLFVQSNTHAFNYVKLNGKWYMIDCTWNDGWDNEEDYKDYFLISNNPAIDSDHEEFSYLVCPLTSSTDYVYKGNEPIVKRFQFISVRKAGTTTSISSAALDEGKTFQLEVVDAKTAITYSSSDSSIATVSSTGKIKGIKPGTCKITIKTATSSEYSATSKTITVYVTPAAPSDMSVVNKTKGVFVSWTKVSSADGYYIYRGDYKIGTISASGVVTSGASVIGDVTESENTMSCIDVAADNGITYKYKVVPYASSGKSQVKIYRYLCRLTTPTIKSLTNSAAGKLTVTNSRNSKAGGYQIQYANNSKYSGAKTLTWKGNTVLTQTVTGLLKGTTYYVRVRAYKTVDGVRYYSSWCSTKNVKITK